MPRYRFVGDFETVLHGLIHGVNATLHRDDHGQPDGSTVVVQPGDEITTRKAVKHTLLVNAKSGNPTIPQPDAPPDEPAAAEDETPASEGASA